MGSSVARFLKPDASLVLTMLYSWAGVQTLKQTNMKERKKERKEERKKERKKERNKNEKTKEIKREQKERKKDIGKIHLGISIAPTSPNGWLYVLREECLTRVTQRTVNQWELLYLVSGELALKVAGSSPSSGSELTFRSGLLLTEFSTAGEVAVRKRPFW
jgi:hypothetical protein